MSLLLFFGGPVPVNTVLPVITGLAQVGHSVVTTTGTWINSPTSYSYQWYRALTDGTNVSLTAILTDENGDPLGVTITGATSAEYLITAADAGEILFVEVTATNSRGSAYVDVLTDIVTVPSHLDPTDGGFARKNKKRKYKALVELDELRAELSAIERLRKLTEAPKKPAEIKRNDDEEALLALLH